MDGVRVREIPDDCKTRQWWLSFWVALLVILAVGGALVSVAMLVPVPDL
jgi:hypothetical protein